MKWREKYPPDPLTNHVWHSINGGRRCLKCACKPTWDIGKQQCLIANEGVWAYNMMEARLGESRERYPVHEPKRKK